jgi:hypothetical protein
MARENSLPSLLYSARMVLLVLGRRSARLCVVQGALKSCGVLDGTQPVRSTEDLHFHGHECLACRVRQDRSCSCFSI